MVILIKTNRKEFHVYTIIFLLDCLSIPFFCFLAPYIFSYHVDRDRKEKIKEQSLCNEAFRIIKGLHSKSNTFFPLSCLFKLPNYPNYESQTKQNGPKYKFVFDFDHGRIRNILKIHIKLASPFNIYIEINLYE